MDEHGKSESTHVTETRKVVEATMKMEHKKYEGQDDLVLKFTPKAPLPPAPYTHFESTHTETRKTPVPSTEVKNMEHQWAHPSTTTYQSNLHTTRSIFENVIRENANEEALRGSQMTPKPRVEQPWKQRPKSDIYSDVYLEPGPEPEICYAPKPKLERKKSLVETLEENIEKQLETEPDYIPQGGVRLIPMKRDLPVVQPKEKRPLDFQPPAPQPQTVPTEPTVRHTVPTPSKFVKGTFSDTNYESDFSDYSYFEKKFKHVTPPRPKSTEPNQQAPRVTGDTPKYDFSSMPLKQMIQSGSPIPLPNPSKSRPASGYFADTEDQGSYGFQSNADNRIYNQVGECGLMLCFLLWIQCCMAPLLDLLIAFVN